jgi:glycosyltransferase involved in cell wall biosynthesis
MHVGIVTETYLPEVNGVAMTLGKLVEGLTARGHRVQLVRPAQGEDDRPVSNDALREHLTPGFGIPFYPQLRTGFATRGSLRRLWREDRPEVLYIATEGPLGWVAARQAAAWDIPALSGFHTRFAHYSRHYHLGWLEPAVERYLRTFHRNTSCTLVPTQELQLQLEALDYGCTEVMSRGVDCQSLGPERRSVDLRASWGVSGDELVVLYVGRLAVEKNLEDAIAAFEAIQWEQPAARFVVVGDGPMHRQLAIEHPDFIFCGTRTGEDLARHYASADLFLFPSRTETFGNVVLEAMASGLPVVAYDYAAAALHMAGGKAGLAVPLDDTDAFVRAALRLAQSSQQRRQTGALAREQACRMDWAAVVGRFESLLQRYSGRGRHARSSASLAVVR